MYVNEVSVVYFFEKTKIFKKILNVQYCKLYNGTFEKFIPKIYLVGVVVVNIIVSILFSECKAKNHFSCVVTTFYELIFYTIVFYFICVIIMHSLYF